MSPSWPSAGAAGVEVGVGVEAGVGVGVAFFLATSSLRSVSLVSLTLRAPRSLAVACGPSELRTGAAVATAVGAGGTAVAAGLTWATAVWRSARGVAACWTSTAPAVTIAAAARPAAAFEATVPKPT